MRRVIKMIFVQCLLMILTLHAAEDNIITMPDGRIRGVLSNGEVVPVLIDYGVVMPGWSAITTMSARYNHDYKFTRDDKRRNWSSKTQMGSATYSYSQTVGANNSVNISVSADRDTNTRAVMLFLSLPVNEFVGGEMVLLSKDGDIKKALPKEISKDKFLSKGMFAGIKFSSATKNQSLKITFDKLHEVVVQDDRVYGAERYVVFVSIAGGKIAKDNKISAKFSLQAKTVPDNTPASIDVTGVIKNSRFDGMGGNLCFTPQKKVVDFALDNLKPAWARVEMSLDDWEPVNDNTDAAVADAAKFSSSDKPKSVIRRELEIAKNISDRKIPLCAAVWRIPAWLSAMPPKDKWTNGRVIGSGMMPELAESIVQYLLYAKKKYGVEYELFSINEPDIGVCTSMSVRECVELSQLLTTRIKKAGLRTKILVADCAAASAIDSALGMLLEKCDGYGALSFHTWDAPRESILNRWRVLSNSSKLPLIIGEVGVDPLVYKMPWHFSAYSYALREIELYQKLLKFARPKTVLHWQFTDNYGLVGMKDGKPFATTRFKIMQHYSLLTPRPADQLECKTSGKISVVGYVNKKKFALHIANTGAAREVLISSKLEFGTGVRAVCTTADKQFSAHAIHAIKAEGKGWRVSLPARSFVTITNVKPAPAAMPAQ